MFNDKQDPRFIWSKILHSLPCPFSFDALTASLTEDFWELQNPEKPRQCVLNRSPLAVSLSYLWILIMTKLAGTLVRIKQMERKRNKKKHKHKLAKRKVEKQITKQ